MQVHHTLLWGYLVSGEARTKLGQLVGAQEALSHALHHTRIYTRMVRMFFLHHAVFCIYFLVFLHSLILFAYFFTWLVN